MLAQFRSHEIFLRFLLLEEHFAIQYFFLSRFHKFFTTLKKDVRKIYPQSLPLTVADNSENEQLRKVNEEQSKKISNFQREITILEEKLKEKDAELKKRKTELSHLRHNRFNTMAGPSSTQMFSGSQSNSQSQIDLTLVDQENIHFDWIKEEQIIDRTEKFSSKVLAVDDKVRV